MKKKINKTAPVKCSKTVIIDAKKEKVWSVMTNIDNWPNWQTDISSAKVKGELQPESTFEWKTGGAKIKSRLHTVQQFKNFGWVGKSLGVFAIHNWTLTESDGQTIVSVEESMEGFLAKLFRNPFNKTLERGMLNWLHLLLKECEK